METLKIVSFPHLPAMEYEIKKLNLIIGEQASGKSLLSKLIYFFQSVPDVLVEGIIEGVTYKQSLNRVFKDYFSNLCRLDIDIEYVYTTGVKIGIKRNSKGLSFPSSREIEKIYNHAKGISANKTISKDFALNKEFRTLFKCFFGEEIENECLYMSATRGFYSMIRSEEALRMMSMRPKSELEPFTKGFIGKMDWLVRWVNKWGDEFASDPLSIRISSVFESIAHGKPIIRANNDIDLEQSGSILPLHFSSSGQQELIPMQIGFQGFHYLSAKLDLNNKPNERGVSYGVTDKARFLFILEEPESHIFPSAQKDIVDLIISYINLFKGKITFIITTHSPYVLKALNNGLIRGKSNNNPDGIRIADCNVSHLSNNGAQSIINEEHGIVIADAIDSVAQQIDDEFIKLLYN